MLPANRLACYREWFLFSAAVRRAVNLRKSAGTLAVQGWQALNGCLRSIRWILSPSFSVASNPSQACPLVWKRGEWALRFPRQQAWIECYVVLQGAGWMAVDGIDGAHQVCTGRCLRAAGRTRFPDRQRFGVASRGFRHALSSGTVMDGIRAWGGCGDVTHGLCSAAALSAPRRPACSALWQRPSSAAPCASSTRYRRR